MTEKKKTIFIWKIYIQNNVPMIRAVISSFDLPNKLSGKQLSQNRSYMPFFSTAVFTLRLTLRMRSFFILPTKIKILHTNNVKVSKDQKMKKNQRLTGPFWRKGELTEGSWSKFS